MSDEAENLSITKCARVIAAMHAGAICPSEMFYQLDSLIQLGQEEEFIEHIPVNTKHMLEDIFADRKIRRDDYGVKYRTHLALCDAGFRA
ncbi:MAG: hypothetical protein KTR15_03450 [Phycisphaeraceae bacterium]|nr:hypothetical protein [Phycisphaeraceae bacterium]